MINRSQVPFLNFWMMHNFEFLLHAKLCDKRLKRSSEAKKTHCISTSSFKFICRIYCIVIAINQCHASGCHVPATSKHLSSNNSDVRFVLASYIMLHALLINEKKRFYSPQIVQCMSFSLCSLCMLKCLCLYLLCVLKWTHHKICT